MYLKDAGALEIKSLKTELLGMIRTVEGLIEKHQSWKKDLGSTATWKQVAQAAPETLLAHGVGAALQGAQKQYLKVTAPKEETQHSSFKNARQSNCPS